MEGLFYSFNIPVEVSVALGALIVLIAFQSFFLIRRIRIKKAQRSPDIARAGEVLKSLKQASKKTSTSPVPTEKLDSGVFAQFESNLKKQSEKQQESPKEEKEVIVSLSPQSKSGYPPNIPGTAAKPPVQPPKPVATGISKEETKKRFESLRKLNKSIKVDPIEGLFDDVEEDIDISQRVPVPEKEKKPDPLKPISSNEFLTDEDLTPDTETRQEGIELVLSMARRDFKDGNYESALAAIRQYLQDQVADSIPSEQLIQLISLKGDCEFELQQYDRASKTLQEIITQHITKNSPDYIPELEKVVEKFKSAGQEKHSIHFMFTVLNEYRQLHDHMKMDQTYDDIEIAYRQTEDWPRLIQTYQNHLSIKKALKDFQGQLDLLDQLGKLLYDQGEAEKSRKCYKQRLVIEKEMERSAKRR